MAVSGVREEIVIAADRIATYRENKISADACSTNALAQLTAASRAGDRARFAIGLIVADIKFQVTAPNILCILNSWLIQANCTADCERVFSKTTRLETPDRNRMLDETVECNVQVQMHGQDVVHSTEFDKFLREVYCIWHASSSHRAPALVRSGASSSSSSGP
jgi:hypothetical protein